MERNITRLIDECEKPDEETRKARYIGMNPGRVPHYLLTDNDALMTMEIETADDGSVRLECRRQRKDGKKPHRILWSVAPAMKCFMTDFVVVYGTEVREIWTRDPGKPVVCDRYAYDEKTDTHEYYLDNVLQCRLRGGEYVLPMDEFWLTEIRDHPEAGADIVQ